MPKKILYVDDSPTMQACMKMTLEMAGFSVELAGDGVQALAKLKVGTKPDLIITDINMPNMGGIELIEKVRALAGFRFVPILTLTTESQAAKREEAKKLGATGWMEKPVSNENLLKVIKQVVPGA
jgi:two-component system, chemotaxis family, chemotaxis protein CheY